MCILDKKDVLHAVAFSHCLRVPALGFTWPPKCKFFARFSVQLDQFLELVYWATMQVLVPTKSRLWKPVVRFKVKWNTSLHEESLLRKRWQITLLRCLCGEAKFELEQFIMSSCTSKLFYNISTELLTYLITERINSQYFDPSCKLAVFLVRGLIR